MAQNELMTPPEKEMDTFKKPPTMDELIEAKLAPVIVAINNHVQKIYKDFNTALSGQQQYLEKVEVDISRMVTGLWGIVEKANARALALETVLLKNGMNPKELEDEIKVVIDMLKQSKDFKEVPLSEVLPSIPEGDHLVVEAPQDSTLQQ